MQRCVLAYSGGLGSTIAAHWLIQHQGFEVLALSVNLGQSDGLSALGEYAIELGADAAHVVDARQRFLAEFCLPALYAEARTRGGAPMGRQLAHEVVAEEAVQLARQDRCTAVAYGGSAATRRGEGPARFARAMAALAPDIELLLPCEKLQLGGREAFLAYADKHGIRPWYDDCRCSMDETCWGRSVSLGAGGDFDSPVPAEVFRLTCDPQAAPAEPRVVKVGFEAGTPVLLDGIRLEMLQLVATLDEIAAGHGVGRMDVVEFNREGERFREVHECPAAAVLQTAYRALLQICLTADHQQVAERLSRSYSLLIQHGGWRQPVRRSADAFFEDTRRLIHGSVRCQLHKGACTVTGRRSGPLHKTPAPTPLVGEEE